MLNSKTTRIVKPTTVAVRKMLEVEPSVLVGAAPRIYVHVCTACGAIMGDPELHVEWHLEQASS